MSKDNPLYSIFFKTSKGTLTEKIESVDKIELFFKFLEDENIESNSKEEMLKEFIDIIHQNRYLSAFFSSSKNKKSIYIYLFDLFINKNTSNQLKDIIISLLELLRINIQAGKDVYEYLFQHFSKIYRCEITPKSDNVYPYLQLLNAILGNTMASLRPKNYFACNGGRFFVNLNERIKLEYSFSINLNFKISNIYDNEKGPENNRNSILVKIYFSNDRALSVNLEDELSLILVGTKNDFPNFFGKSDSISLFKSQEITKIQGDR